MKKKILSFIFAVCLIIPCIFVPTACSASSGKAWGKTFTYQGKYIRDFDSFNDENDPRALLTQEFSENNLNLENVEFCYTSSKSDNDGKPIEIKISADFSGAKNVDELISQIDQKVTSIFQESCRSLRVSVGNKDEKRITINGVEYELSDEPTENQGLSAGTWGVVNKDYDPDDPTSYKFIAYIDENLRSIKYKGDTTNSTVLIFSQCSPKDTAIMVKVYTKSYKEGTGFLSETGTESYIYINFFADLSLAN